MILAFKSITRRTILKTFRNSFDILSVIKYIFIFATFLIFNSLESEVLPYSTAIYVSALSNGVNVIPLSLLFLASFLVLNAPGLLGSAGIIIGLFTIISIIYTKFKLKFSFEMVAYCAVALTGFIFIGDTINPITFDKRILTTILIIALTFLSVIASKAVCSKGLKFKFGFEEISSLAVITALFGLGVSNLVSPYLWKGFSVLLLLIICYVYRTGISALFSAVLGVSLAIYFKNLNYIAVFLLWSVCIESFSSLSRFAGAVAVIACDYLIQVIFSVYPDYQLIEFFSVLIGAVVFCLTPTKLLKNLKDKLYSFREKQLTREAINRNRTMLSGRLYDLSGVFCEMANAFNIFKNNDLTEAGAKDVMEKQVFDTVCRECDNYIKCKKNIKNTTVGIQKIIDIGFAKGKLSLIDLPRELSENCIHPNNILFGLNKLLAEYRIKLIENANTTNGRELIAEEALGVAEILKGLALETGALLKYQSRLERKLSENLFKAGFNVNELLLYGENDKITVCIVTAMQEFSITGIKNTISKTLGIEMDLLDRSKINEEKCYLSFRKAVTYDVAIGVAKAVKDGSDTSGDTHALSRIGNDKFLLALSDGMGSGKKAETVSSATLSLIESFYKAGLSSNLILKTVNKLLAINTEDCFSALDISVIDLETCSADFIKYGSPYGFIINDNGIKIVEGNSLPLGIIDELKPSVATTTLCDGDMVLLVTDGISDSFGSSGEVIDFLRTVPAKNPQTLADDVLSYAISLSGGNKKDDMTVLAVRVYKRISS